MKINLTSKIKFIVTGGLLCAAAAQADPLLTSWFTANSGKYARIYTSTANRTSGVSATTWTGQTLPTYAGVHEIDYSTNWVYIRNSGLASFVIGPWNNPNWASNQGGNTPVYRFPRGIAGVTNYTTSKTLTTLGAIGFLVDGVSIYNTSDGFSYSFNNSKDATPNGSIGSGDGIWNRDAYPNEYSSFDYALNHPPQNGQYHSHVNPIGTRYVLGDNVNYNSSAKTYSENTANMNLAHSPIIGWLNDGLPLYGPYGYSDPTSPASGVRRMISGYVLRDGSCGNSNLNVNVSPYTTGRTTLPLWAQQAQNKTTLTTSQFGPATTYTSGNGMNALTYGLGHYVEDYDYLGDLGFTQGVTNTVGDYTAFYDLNKYNARYCVTPEYPNGTWAYFVTIKADGSPTYPYMTGRWYFGSPTGGSTTTTVMNSDTPLTQYFKGATNLQAVMNAPGVDASGNVSLVWSAVEGGTYQVNVSSNLVSAWTTNLALILTATNNAATVTETNAAANNNIRFYRINRTSVATFDSTGY
jgi:YHYH protein